MVTQRQWVGQYCSPFSCSMHVYKSTDWCIPENAPCHVACVEFSTTSISSSHNLYPTLASKISGLDVNTFTIITAITIINHTQGHSWVKSNGPYTHVRTHTHTHTRHTQGSQIQVTEPEVSEQLQHHKPQLCICFSRPPGAHYHTV